MITTESDYTHLVERLESIDNNLGVDSEEYKIIVSKIREYEDENKFPPSPYREIELNIPVFE